MGTKRIAYIKFGIDLVMAVVFVLFFNIRVFGGLTFHEIAGLVIIAVFFTHVLLNWRWVKNITLKLFSHKLPLKTKLGYILNLLLLITMGFIIVSGIFISKVVFPDIDIGNQRWFKVTHISVSFLTLIIVAVHVGMHWKWIVHCFKNLFNLKSTQPVFRIVAKTAVAVLLVFGIYQLTATNFFGHLQGVAAVFIPSSASGLGEGGFKNGDGSDFANRERLGTRGDFEDGEHLFGKHNFTAGDAENSPGKDLRDGDFRSKGGDHHASANPFGVILSYFSIMAIFIVAVYYLEKWIRNRKRGKIAPLA
nr:DUF4405 domain-containing protein [uncultured Bacillus sp.]